MKKAASLIASAIATVLVTGCAATSSPATSLVRSDATLRPVAQQQSAPQGPVDLAEALARGLSYNTRYREAYARYALNANRAGLTPRDFMPRTTLAAGADFRSNIDASVGVRVDDMGGERPDDFYTASDRDRTFSSFSTSWNLLDFGLTANAARISQAQAARDAQQSLISCAYLSEDIVRVYWLAAAYERASHKEAWLRTRIDFALAQSNARAEAAPETRTAELQFQRELIDIYRWYQSILIGVAGSKAELGTLMNLPAGTDFEVAADQAIQPLPPLPSDTGDLLDLAFSQRPEIAQRTLADKVLDLQRRREILASLPSPALVFGGRTDSNSFALNNSFTSLGASISWDLFHMASLRQRLDRNTDEKELARLETETVATAIALQVEMARIEYAAREESITMAWTATDIQVELTGNMARQVEDGIQPEMYLVKEELLRELSVLRRDIDRAGHQATRMRFLRSLGLAPDCHALPTDEGHSGVRDVLVSQGFATQAETG